MSKQFTSRLGYRIKSAYHWLLDNKSDVAILVDNKVLAKAGGIIPHNLIMSERIIFDLKDCIDNKFDIKTDCISFDLMNRKDNTIVNKCIIPNKSIIAIFDKDSGVGIKFDKYDLLIDVSTNEKVKKLEGNPEDITKDIISNMMKGFQNK